MTMVHFHDCRYSPESGRTSLNSRISTFHKRIPRNQKCLIMSPRFLEIQKSAVYIFLLVGSRLELQVRNGLSLKIKYIWFNSLLTKV